MKITVLEQAVPGSFHAPQRRGLHGAAVVHRHDARPCLYLGQPGQLRQRSVLPAIEHPLTHPAATSTKRRDSSAVRGPKNHKPSGDDRASLVTRSRREAESARPEPDRVPEARRRRRRRDPGISPLRERCGFPQRRRSMLRYSKMGESTMHSSPASRSWLIAAAVAAALAAPTAALSQQQEEEFEEIVVTGTRKGGQSPTETLSPVDMLSGQLLSDQATFDLTEGLPKVTPSINTQRFPIADGTAFIRPVTLRNLSPDHTLVLMNGVRRHRSALVNLQLAPLGTVNQGSQGVDFAAFPAAAIERVEILRDGAAAQYGSYAIAGVINVILKDAPEGGSLSAQYGEYYESDGERLSVSGNIGLPLGADGFVNLAGEYSESDITWRGHPRGDAVAFEQILGPGVVPLNGFGQRWGDPDVEALKFSVNAGLDLTDSVELYGFATYMDNTTKSDFFYRGPVIT